MTRQLPDNLHDRALALLRGRQKVKDLVLGLVEVDRVPSTGTAIYRVDGYRAGDPNGPRQVAVLDEDGAPVDLKALAKREGREFFAPEPVSVPEVPALPAPASAATIAPKENVFLLEPGEHLEEQILVTLPASPGRRVDVYLLADTTGSMGTILSAVQAGATTIVNSLNALGLDIAFAVGNYKDFGSGDPFAFQHQLVPTKAMTPAGLAAVTGAIGAWSASGGGDGPEGQLYALHQIATVPTIGWRPGAKRIVAWFGDAPGHEPVCKAISGLLGDIALDPVSTSPTSQISLLQVLKAANITVVAISTNTGLGLDGNPQTGASDYIGDCGSPGGKLSQATTIAIATGGQHVSGINSMTFVQTLVGLVTAAATTINNLSLVATGGIGPFVVGITPAGGYGPLSSKKDHELLFTVKFRGIPCADVDRIYTGFLDAVADGVVVARKPVRITVPACKVYSYCVKFVCGVQESCDCGCVPVRPGIYATEINLHNYQDVSARIEKRVLPLVFAGAPQGREPRAVGARATDRIVLRPGTATMDDCCRITELLFGTPPPAKLPLTLGFLEIVSTVELQVTAVYTATDLEGRSITLDVEQVTGKVRPARRTAVSGGSTDAVEIGGETSTAGDDTP